MSINIEKILISNDLHPLPEVELVQSLLFEGLSEDPSPPTSVYEDYLKSDFILTSEDHGTIRISSEAGRYRCSMVLKTLLSKYFAEGLTFKEYWIVLELAAYLQGNRPLLGIKDDYERHIVFISMLILKYGQIQGFRQFELLPIQKILESENLLVKVTNPRTYQSLKEHWHWSRIVKVTIVPVDSRFLERNDRTKRYDSYTKGYGEGSSRAFRNRDPRADLVDEFYDQDQLKDFTKFDEIIFSIVSKILHFVVARKFLRGPDDWGRYY